MKVIAVRAKVCHLPEEQMEAQGTYDLGNIAKSKEWSWKMKGLEVPAIYSVEEYDAKRSIIMTYDDEKILVQEPFESLFARWEALKETQPWVENSDEDEEDEFEEKKDEEDED